jgi:hypothetical protein
MVATEFHQLCHSKIFTNGNPFGKEGNETVVKEMPHCADKASVTPSLEPPSAMLDHDWT